ncbi:phosphatidylinositol-glycan biosynthesis class S protein-domain-containing protein [Ephemerocybe angulata]|uniref:Phosphatidylinositol-glycan biosynthesis class S protein-domain-containing protein n=1 Tax=Ephemerocybe angulata TaxID=980116 RepID=A0A8H6IEV2_9AGAR|nr:phosphatidylinositol-glycan biosynthesis class S protein-domain-containing protein [Tulosesus angulatus]
MDPQNDLAIPSGLRNPADLFFQKETIRRTIIASYWITILLALPLWWHTTSIERLPLPEARVYHQVDKPISIPVRLCLPQSNTDLSSRLQGALSARVPKGLEVVVESGNCGTEKDTYVVSPGPKKIVRGRHLTTPFDDLEGLTQTIVSLVAPSDVEQEKQTRVAQFASRYRLAFSLLNEDASSGNGVMSWDVQKGIHQQIQPLLDVLKPLHNFTIESQVQFYAPLEFDLRPTDSGFGLSYEDLTVFINSAEWTLSSSASNDPVLHFILFVPSASHTPLRIIDSKSSAFILPQWGGVSIYNTPSIWSTQQLSDRGLQRAFSTFSTQLSYTTWHSSSPEDTGLISQWQLDALIRRRMLETAKGTRDTLRSFIKLANQLENMPVREDVRNDIEGSLDALEKLYNSASTSLSQSFAYSAEAFNLASRAFFNPGMLALLYFPTEHKYAVYAPLFASGLVPLFVSALRELKAWKQQRAQSR